MIDLTPIDVRKKKNDFPRGIRGYRAAEVDLFLDLTADRLEELVGEVLRLEARVQELDGQVRQYRERERALTEALTSAQEIRDEMRRQAEKDAELVHREAEADAERVRLAALRAREQEEEAMRRLRARRLQFVRSFRAFLERELSELEVADAAVEPGGEAEPAPLAPPAQAPAEPGAQPQPPAQPAPAPAQPPESPAQQPDPGVAPSGEPAGGEEGA